MQSIASRKLTNTNRANKLLLGRVSALVTLKIVIPGEKLGAIGAAKRLVLGMGSVMGLQVVHTTKGLVTSVPRTSQKTNRSIGC